MKSIPGKDALVGLTTAGSSGNPASVSLGNAFAVNFPRWVAADLDGNRIERNGIVPSIEVPCANAAACYTAPDGSDPTLLAAIAELDKAVATHAAGSDSPSSAASSNRNSIMPHATYKM